MFKRYKERGQESALFFRFAFFGQRKEMFRYAAGNKENTKYKFSVENKKIPKFAQTERKSIVQLGK
jgi:hypothetical protein